MKLSPHPTTRNVRDAWSRARALAHEAQALSNCEWADSRTTANAFRLAMQANTEAEALQARFVETLKAA